jgi:chromosome partitioning protein
MVNALAACERLLIPVQTEFLALKGLERMVHTLSMIQKARKQQVSYTIVPTFFDRRLKASIETLRTLRTTYEQNIWDGVIPVDTLFREASRQGIPLSIARPSCRGSRAYSHLLDYMQALDESAPANLVNEA